MGAVAKREPVQARTPPTLHEPTMFAVLGAFVALLIALLVAFYMRFRTRS